MRDRPTTRLDWKCEAMPENRLRLDHVKQLRPEEVVRVRFGLLPEQMEDKWFIYAEDETLYFVRSWTGFTIYRASVRIHTDGSATLEAIEINTDPEQHRMNDPQYHARLFDYLIDRLLLGKTIPFPSLPGVADAAQGIAQHAVVGRGALPEEKP